jgi:DNA polymerase IV (DinB-like DNA polymerase)
MLVDLDYFYAQCEEMRNPSIKGKPVVVCVYSGRRENSVVSTANYITRKYGVKSGISISLAKKKLKGAASIFLPVDHPFYKVTSEKIMNILRGYADHFEQVGIDEAYQDVTERTKNNYINAEKLAALIKSKISVKEKLTCSIGVGPNKIVAKIASGVQKPDGLTIVKAHDVASFLSQLSVRRMVGVGKKTEKKLETLGVRTIGHLSRFDVQRLVEIFGRKKGTYFHNASNGIDNEPVQERVLPESLSRISTLKENTKTLVVILDEAYKLCDEVFSKLFLQGLVYKSVSVYIVGSDLAVFSRSRTFENSKSDLQTFKQVVSELLVQFFNESNVEARRIGVKVSNLKRKEIGQKQLMNFF